VESFHKGSRPICRGGVEQCVGGCHWANAVRLAVEAGVKLGEERGYETGWNACRAARMGTLEQVKRAGAREEREACAKLCRDEAEAWQDGDSNATTCLILAGAISARGKEGG
jgi:hypothetical protein